MVLEFKRIPALKDKEHDNHELRWYRGSKLVLKFMIFLFRKKEFLWKKSITLLPRFIIHRLIFT